MKLLEAIKLHTFPCVISIVGAGGKSSTMIALAKELAVQGKKVLVTTTTHISIEQGERFQALIVENNYERAKEKIQAHIDYTHTICLVSHRVAENKYKGISKEWVDNLILEGYFDVIIVEADGAKGRSFKAPGEAEPVIPGSTNINILVIGMDAIYKPITEEFVHRPEIILKLSGYPEDKWGIKLTESIISRVIFHKQGLLKGIHTQDAVFILINKVGLQKEEQVVVLTKEILRQGKQYKYSDLKVLIGEVQNSKNPVSILLDGESYLSEEV
jgi:probable selenium-dependent hydroxylase accessory protein YqeC